MKRIMLVDAKNLVYRAHFGNMGMKDSKGRPTSVLFGFPSSILDLEKKVGPSDIVVVWDNGNPTHKKKRDPKQPMPEIWRKAIARETYKANRTSNPEGKIALAQIPALVELLSLCGFQQIGVEGLEADDLMGLCAHHLATKPDVKQVFILSNDRDHFQLVGGKTMILYPGRALKILDEEAIQNETGVWPYEWAAYKALAGDSSDNFKAVKGIGPKMAIAYLRAGVDPSRKFFSSLPDGVQKRFSALAVHWEAIHRCYILSRIPTRPGFRHFPEGADSLIRKVLQDVSQKRERKFNEAALDLRTRHLIRFLSDYEMFHLISRKRDFFRSVVSD